MQAAEGRGNMKRQLLRAVWTVPVLVSCLLVPASVSALAAVGQPPRVSVGGNWNSEHASTSGDGRYVAFESAATNLVDDDTNGRLDIFVHDRQTGRTARVSVGSASGQGGGGGDGGAGYDEQPSGDPEQGGDNEPGAYNTIPDPPPPSRNPASIFSPSLEEIRAWVNYGIDMAALSITEDQLHEIGRVQRRVWCQQAGMPIMSGRTLRYVVALVPEFVAITAGWQAAWNEPTWNRIQANRQSVVEELARGIWLHWELVQGNQLTFAVGIEHWQTHLGGQGPISYALYSAGHWYALRPTRPTPHLTFAHVNRPYPVTTPEGAARYAMSLVARHPRITRPEQTHVSLATLHRANSPRPAAALIALVPPMPWVGPDKYVHIIGSLQRICYFERELY